MRIVTPWVLSVAIFVPAAALAEPFLESFQVDEFVDPVEIEVLSDGAPQVDRPIVLDIVLTARWSTLAPATVVVRAPEAVLVAGDAARAVVLPLDESVTLHVTLVPRAAGEHLVEVDVLGAFGGHGQAWLVVPEDGLGAVHTPSLAAPTFALAAVPLPPDAVVRAPFHAPGGPIPPAVPAQGLPLPSSDFVDSDGPVVAESHSTFVARVCLSYESETVGTFEPQRWVGVKFFDRDSSTSDDELSYGLAGDDGCYTSGAISRAEESGGGNQDVYVLFYTAHGTVAVESTPGTAYVSNVGYANPTTVGAQDTLEMGSWVPPSDANYRASHRVFEYLNNAWQYSAWTGGFDPGQVKATVPDSCTYYTLADNRIHLCANGVDDKSPDDVGHEYGHFVQDKAYGDAYWPSPGGPHSFCDDNQNRGLSWTEGFANFFGASTDQQIARPGTTGDGLYSRPWNGAQFSFDPETAFCSGVAGDDSELNVLRSMWDLRDAANDGWDLSTASIVTVLNEMRDCDDANYRDVYDGGCSWVSKGNPRCDFVRTALQGGIDFDVVPTAPLTTQTSFQWVRGTMTIAASPSDDGCPNVTTVAFHVSGDSVCATSDPSAGTRTTAPWSVSFDSTTFGDDGSVWTCALASDGHGSSWQTSSSSVGIDNGAPTATVTTPVLAIAVGYDVSWVVTDATSGLTGSLQVQELPPLATGFATVCTTSVSGTTASGSCTRNPVTPGQYCYRVVVADVAGNVLTGPGSSCTIRL